MCGIAGFITSDPNRLNLPTLKAMTDIIAHRGPDGDGHWISSNGNVGLGHRRLSIIDLSHEADQPMHYGERYTIAFNGEIYNYIELKAVLVQQGYTFKNESDTEVLMALYQRDGKDCLQLLDGMFSFVIYDNQTNKIFIARDRFGEKPFYYSYKKGQYFYFGSEMKCLWAGGIKKEVNNRALYAFLSQGHLENINDLSETFYDNCTRLPQSCYAFIDVNNVELSIQKYYTIEKTVDTVITLKQAKEKFSDLFYNSVARRLRSDVPVGSSLSGGLDSSLVVCVIDALKGKEQQQKTFSAEFPGFIKDERKYQDYVINKTNVAPYFVTPNDDEMLATLDALNWHQEEPYGSASIFVQYCVMRLAKQQGVTVLLDGQGADEILAGYHPYYNYYFDELRKTDKQAYKQQYDAYLALQGSSIINQVQKPSLVSKIKSTAAKTLPGLRNLYFNYRAKSQTGLSTDFSNAYKNVEFGLYGNRLESLNDVLHYHTTHFGLQQLLRYADRNSMAHSREVRLPFLNHELVEFLFTLPPQFKINQGWTKWIMRETFSREMPTEIAWRKDKIGYEPPQASWMQNKKITDKIYSVKETLFKEGIIRDKDKALNANQNWVMLMTEMLINK
jgi:asparagine synthase (glutamine-hydrolysing)